MVTYASTFLTGTQEIIQTLLKKRKAKIIHMLDGLVVYATDYPLHEVQNFRFFHNTCIVLAWADKVEVNFSAISRLIAQSSHDSRVARNLKMFRPKKARSFKVVTFLENETVFMEYDILKKIEKTISQTTKLRLEIKNPDSEYWVMVRSEGVACLGLRITDTKHRVRPQKGELSPHVAHILNVLALPSPKDVVLDPCAGYGAIFFERAQSFPYTKMIMVDTDREKVDFLQKRFAKTKGDKEILQGDARDIKNIPDSSIDAIITDPPWGMFRATEDSLEALYTQMVTEWGRVLKKGGRMVVLMGQKEIFQEVINARVDLQLLETYHTLISGKKAGIFVLTKR